MTSVVTGLLEEARFPIHTACGHQTSLWGDSVTVKTLLAGWATISHSTLNKYLLKASKCQELSFTVVLVWSGDTTPCPRLVHTLARTAGKGSEQLNYIGCWAVVNVLGVRAGKGEKGKTPWGGRADGGERVTRML